MFFPLLAECLSMDSGVNVSRYLFIMGTNNKIIAIFCTHYPSLNDSKGAKWLYYIMAMFSSHPINSVNTKKTSHRMFRHMHGVLNEVYL